VADEVIDLLLPVLFYHVRARRWRKIQSRDDRPRDSATQSLTLSLVWEYCC